MFWRLGLVRVCLVCDLRAFLSLFFELRVFFFFLLGLRGRARMKTRRRGGFGVAFFSISTLSCECLFSSWSRASVRGVSRVICLVSIGRSILFIWWSIL